MDKKNNIRCNVCKKKAAKLNVVGAPDGRPQYKCGFCGYTWTQGNPYK